jgi:hypothetical protein
MFLMKLSRVFQRGRWLFTTRAGARVEGAALLVVDDVAAPSVSRQRCVRPRRQETELAYLLSSDKARASLAENYVGLPF